jgi:hypothetical protein
MRLFDRFRKWADSIGINTSKVTMFVELSLKESILDQVEKKDVLLSYPFESMKPFIKMLNDAAKVFMALQKGEVVEDVEELLAAPIYDEKIRERIRYTFDMIMKDDEKGKEQNAQGLYENRVINEISVNSQEVFYQDAYDRCVKEVSYNTQNKMCNIVHKRMRLYIIIQQKSPETCFFC